MKNKQKYMVNCSEVDEKLLGVLLSCGVLNGVKSHDDPMGRYNFRVLNFFDEIDDWNERYAQLKATHAKEVSLANQENMRNVELCRHQKETIEAQRQTIDAQKEYIKALKANVSIVPEADITEIPFVRDGDSLRVFTKPSATSGKFSFTEGGAK